MCGAAFFIAVYSRAMLGVRTCLNSISAFARICHNIQVDGTLLSRHGFVYTHVRASFRVHRSPPQQLLTHTHESHVTLRAARSNGCTAARDRRRLRSRRAVPATQAPDQLIVTNK